MVKTPSEIEELYAEAQKQISALEAVGRIYFERIKTLEEALKPFAAIPPTIYGTDNSGSEMQVIEAAHYWVVIGHPGKSSFTREDLQRAKDALEMEDDNAS